MLQMLQMRECDEQFHINKFENLDEKADIMKIIRGYREHWFEKLNELDKSLKKYVLPKWTREEME